MDQVTRLPTSHNTLLGTAGEMLVCAKLNQMGYPCFFAAQGLRYDLVVDVKGKLYRIQVKATQSFRVRKDAKETRTNCYLFRVRSSSKKRQKLYVAGDFDILALVVLDTGEVAFLDSTHSSKKAIQLKPKNSPKHSRRKNTHNIDELTFEKVLETLDERSRTPVASPARCA